MVIMEMAMEMEKGIKLPTTLELLTYHAGQPAEDGQQDVDEEIRVAPGLEEDGQWREEEREEV